MAIVATIKQENKKIKKMNYPKFKKWMEQQNLAFGVRNEARTLDKYNRRRNIRGTSFVIYNPTMIGRGVEFLLDTNYNVELYVNYFNSEHDIRLFYKLIKNLCSWIETTRFYQEEELYSLDDLKRLEKESLNFNQRLLKEDLEQEMIFGAAYPISIESSFLKKCKKLEEQEFSKQYQIYLNEKQQGDYYYANTLLRKEKGEIVGYYVLTENIPSIIPLIPHIPFGYQLPEGLEVKKWSVAFVKLPEFRRLGFIPFDQLSRLFDLENCPKFDEEHIVVTVSKEQIELLKNCDLKK